MLYKGFRFPHQGAQESKRASYSHVRCTQSKACQHRCIGCGLSQPYTACRLADLRHFAQKEPEACHAEIKTNPIGLAKQSFQRWGRSCSTCCCAMELGISMAGVCAASNSATCLPPVVIMNMSSASTRGVAPHFLTPVHHGLKYSAVNIMDNGSPWGVGS